MVQKAKTEAEASRLLFEYEQANRDLERSLRRQMSIFVLAPRVGKKAVSGLFDVDVGRTPRRHMGWMWWQALRTSDLAHLWDDFSGQHNSGTSIRDCLYWLRDQASSDSYDTLARRMGGPRRVIPSRRSPATNHSHYWTKGGGWACKHEMTKIIYLGEPLDRQPPDLPWLATARRLASSPDMLRKVERELHNIIDPDSALQPDCLREAVQYARGRFTELIGRHGKPVGYTVLSWFFQCSIQKPNGRYTFWYSNAIDEPPRDGDRDWDWLHKKGELRKISGRN